MPYVGNLFIGERRNERILYGVQKKSGNEERQDS